MDHISEYTNKNMNIFTDRIYQKVIISFLIGLAVGVLVSWMFVATRAMNNPQTENTPLDGFSNIIIPSDSDDTGSSVINKEFSQAGLAKNEAISVSNQPAGVVVTLQQVSLKESGWIVIHEGTMSRIGNALGATRFEAGIHSGEVILLRPMVLGGVYRAVLYHDNGDKVFDLDSDFPVLEDANTPVLSMFVAE